VGVFAPVLGVLTTAVAMLFWAQAGGEDGATRRRRHATSVTMWSGAGTVVILVLMLTILFALVGAAVFNPQLTPSAPPPP
jgi:drug/metabolite transporter (DMT)-like permease